MTGQPAPAMPSEASRCEFAILGPLEIRRDGSPVALPAPRARAVLVILLVHASRVVSVDELCDELWQGHPPASARSALQVHVAAVRRTLGLAAGLYTRAPGYVLELDDDHLDARRFERALGEAQRQLADGRASAGERLRAALALWRGPALAEFANLLCARDEAARLEELRVTALEARVQAELDLGHHVQVVAELRQLISEHPWRERFHGQLMLALYRAGRQADALQAYHHAREVLVGELGIEPGAELRGLQRAILAQDAGLAAPRPAGASAVGLRTALPVPPTLTIGREHDLRAIGTRLRDRSVRLLTLIGPGGVGKTRLAVEAARAIEVDFADGACFVSLAPLQRPEDVPSGIVAALGGIVLSGESPDEAVTRSLAAKDLLLVADNFEHLLDAAPFVGTLLESCPAVTVLATSRERLSLHAEECYVVPALQLPERGASDPPEVLAGMGAVALFCERARAHEPGFELVSANAIAVAEGCRRLDGLPLAIELAAARSRLLSPVELAQRLDAALEAPGAGARDAPARQQTLRATIDWSHDLLADTEKACFARFAVFAGSATVAAAEVVTGTGLEPLDQLIAKSLLLRRQHAQAPTRLAMLATIRAYAAQRLESVADHDAIRARHHRYFLDLARRHGTTRALWGTSGKEHLALLDADGPNLHAALAWAVGRDSAEPALALCVALGPYWLMRDRYRDALECIDRALRMAGADAYPELRARALCDKAWCLWPVGRGAERRTILDDAEAVARTLGDHVLLSYILETRAKHEAAGGRLKVAAPLADEALDCARVAGDNWALAIAAAARALASASAAELRERVDWAAALLQGVGNVYLLADLLASAAYAALRTGHDRDARVFIARAIPVARELDNPYGWMLLQGNLGLATLLTGNADAAREAFREELRMCRELGVMPLASEGLLGLAAIAVTRNDFNRAARLAGAAAAHRYRRHRDLMDAKLDDTFLRTARTARGTEAWDADVRAGAGLTFEDAIAYALQEAGTEAPTAIEPVGTHAPNDVRYMDAGWLDQ